MDTEKNLPSPELPSPIEKRTEKSPERYEEFGNINPELKVQPMPGERYNDASNAVSQALSINPNPVQPQPIGASQASDDDDSQSPAMADDNDVIEKEWVDKAKTIVARTQGDPHAKSSQLTFLKKDYMNKRYGKEIKVPDDQRLSAQT